MIYNLYISEFLNQKTKLSSLAGFEL